LGFSDCTFWCIEFETLIEGFSLLGIFRRGENNVAKPTNSAMASMFTEKKPLGVFSAVVGFATWLFHQSVPVRFRCQECRFQVTYMSITVCVLNFCIIIFFRSSCLVIVQFSIASQEYFEDLGNATEASET